MRVIAGKYKHRLLQWPNDPSTRPTKDRIREAIFSALGDITSKKCLDLYAGSGSMGIEAISRDCLNCYFVDNSFKAISCIKTNILNLGIDNAFVVFKTDKEAIEQFKNDDLKFDLIFMDPPYKNEFYLNTISLLIKEGITSDNAIFVIESESNFDYSKFSFKTIKHYHYGTINIDLLYR